ncbi:MAG: molybdenum cofactor guanylyltransferase [Oleiphilaceae bacterium]|nr:molybdenum cofactor guanylyltransferase [Oleiphilaceae bacterium]
MTAQQTPPELAGLILAGGHGKRLGGCDKGLLAVAGEPFVAPLSRMLRPVVGPLAISANRRESQYRPWCDEVLADRRFSDCGPLAGLYEGLLWARERGCQGVLVAPCDAPLVSAAWARRMAGAAATAPDVAHLSQLATGYQPLHGYFPLTCLDAIDQALSRGEFQVRALVAQLPVQWWDCDEFADEFLNINRPEDLERLG